MLNEVTWRTDYGLAIWNYCLCSSAASENSFKCPLDSKSRATWIEARLKNLLSILNNFAHPEKVGISTLSKGEDAFIIYIKNENSFQDLLKKIRHIEDLIAVDILLTLNCLKPDSNDRIQPLIIQGGGQIIIDLDLDEKGNLDMSFEDPISLAFFLNIDIYSPLTWTKNRDNHELALINGPLLSRFLKNIENKMPAQFSGVDASDYHGIVGRYGFKLS